MKIFLNCIAAIQGGQLTRASEFIDNFIKYSNKNDHLIVIINQHANLDIELNNSIKLIKIYFPLGIFNWIIRMLWENTFQLLLLRSLNPDIYLTFSHYLPLKKLSIPTVVAVSNLAPFSNRAINKEQIFGKCRLKLLYYSIIYTAKIATSIIALSEECKTVLIKNGIDRSKIRIIPNGVSIQSLNCNEVESFKNKNIEIKYLLYVSHFYRYKNFEQLIIAYSCLPDLIKKEFRLKLVGNFSDEKYVNELINLSNKLNISENVDFICGLPEDSLNRLYKNSSLFIFASTIENCPNILLEAMAHSLPILAINIAPIPEFAADAVEYFELNDYEDLAQKIEEQIKSPEKLVKLRSKSLQRSKFYSWKSFTASVLNLCHTTLNN